MVLGGMGDYWWWFRIGAGIDAPGVRMSKNPRISRWLPDPDREDRWARERQRAYQDWYEKKQAEGVAYLRAVRPQDRRRVLEAVRKKFSKQFAEDLERRFWRRNKA